MGDMADVGKIGWIDITVDDAEGLKDFYATVTGWKPERVEMGEYGVIEDPSEAVAALYQAP
jgi:predicted enzyme related to lactoylglutathione lyase